MKNQTNSNHLIFLHFFWLFSVIATGLGYAYNLGFFHHIYKYDISHLTLVIYLIFVCLTIRMGLFAWKADKFESRRDASIGIRDFAEMVNAWATRCQYIGVIGTVAGLGIAFASFSGDAAKTDILAKVGTTVFNILISMGAFLLLDIQCRHIVVNAKKRHEICE